jgi:hypothetical protein
MRLERIANMVGNVRSQRSTSVEIFRDILPNPPNVSKTEHMIALEIGDSTRSTLPSIRGRGVLYVRVRRKIGDSAHWHGPPVVRADPLVQEALDSMDEFAALAASGRDRLDDHARK